MKKPAAHEGFNEADKWVRKTHKNNGEVKSYSVSGKLLLYLFSGVLQLQISQGCLATNKMGTSTNNNLAESLNQCMRRKGDMIGYYSTKSGQS